MSKDIPERVEIEETSEDNSKRKGTSEVCFIGFFIFPAPHTAELLADTLVEALMDLNIDRKVSTITVDNFTTNDAMINHLLQKLPTKDMPLDGKELDIYLEESLLLRARDFDILNWWKTNGVKYPTLQKMARDILAIPVSTVASESAFSSSGKLINPHRNRLHHTTVKALCVLVVGCGTKPMILV
ncbi:UNVERIFIED_CONTAM: putative AC transposase [Sesamum angustifolium]|uniref:AC transposase n=1 Tax=Sesamum angustifolium TaxID=2727405 RepID=A0AAW2JDH1_9LAMI